MKVSKRLKDKVIHLNHLLLKRYGRQGWWPTTREAGRPPVYFPEKEGRVVSDADAFEIIVGSILTQNNTWSNAEKALMNLSGKGLLTIQAMAQATPDAIAAEIVPARYYNQKSTRLVAIANHILHLDGIKPLRHMPTETLRNLLLSWTGVGKETADSILCYAFSRGIFVVDAYTRRLFQKLSLPHGSYEEIQTLVHQSIAPAAAEYGDFHARIVKLYATGDEKTFTL